MGEKSNPKRPPSFALAPIPVEDQYKQPITQRTTWWTRCTRWLGYYSIQIRWDIERWLARRFHRRWGSYPPRSLGPLLHFFVDSWIER